MKRLLVTGSSGLTGSEVVSFFSGEGWEVHGVDNNMRADFFGPQGIPPGIPGAAGTLTLLGGARRFAREAPSIYMSTNKVYGCTLEGCTYRVFGYKGKQVRDNIHAHPGVIAKNLTCDENCCH